jgi:Reverse transcriptase (RNA-dependent DNA polymerase).
LGVHGGLAPWPAAVVDTTAWLATAGSRELCSQKGFAGFPSAARGSATKSECPHSKKPESRPQPSHQCHEVTSCFVVDGQFVVEVVTIEFGTLGGGREVRYAIFSERSFAALIRPNDSARFSINLKVDRETIISNAVGEANSGVPGLEPYSATTRRGKTYVSYARYTDHLVLRAIGRHLMRRYRIKMPTRDEVVRGVIEGLTDATPMYVVRRDIQSFYEAIPTSNLCRSLITDIRTPRNVSRYLEKFFNQHCSSPAGLPRGVGLSAIIAELYMQDFDQAVRQIPQVYRYYRYCDDIFIFLLERPDNLDAQLASILPAGMNFNSTKSFDCDISHGGNGGDVEGIDYLGYSFGLTGGAKGKSSRKVEVGIGERKLARLKARILASFRTFEADNNFQLLLDRLKYLSSNYIVYRNGSTRKSASHVRSGIFYNYKLAGIYSIRYGTELSMVPPGLAELKAIDGFYHSLLIGPSSSVAKILSSRLTGPQLAKLKELSFHKGHALRMLVRYRPYQVALIKKAWQNV